MVIALFWDAGVSMVRTWYGSVTFNHGFLIAPISAYLIWRRREVLARLDPDPCLWGVAALAITGFAWLLGNVANVLVVQQFALIAMIQAAIFIVLGRRVTGALIFPLAYLYFAVPIGEFLVPPLQDFTAVFTVKGLRLVGVPVYLDGIFISVPTGDWEVAEVCAGIRYLIAMIALGGLYANLTYRTWWRRLAFIAVSIVVPIIANGVRAFGIVLLGHLTNNKLAAGVDHLIYGWIFFAVVILLAFALGMLFREPGAGFVPDVSPADNQSTGRQTPRDFVIVTVAAVLAAAAAPVYAAYIESRASDPASAILAPEVAAPWTKIDEDGDWRLNLPGAGLVLKQSYAKGDRRVELAIVYFARQEQGAEVVNAQNSFLDDERWKRASGGWDEVVVDGEPLGVSYTRFIGREGGKVIWYWYWVDGRFTGNPYMAKFLEVKAKLLSGIQGAAVIVVAAKYDDRVSEAEEVLNDFLGNVVSLGTMLQREIAE